LEVLADIPLVFHIGMHKTGTTWLQNSYFSKSSSFNLLNNTSEPWNDELLKEIISADELDFNIHKIRKIIKSRFKEGVINVVSAERLSGHPISGGFDMEKIAKRIGKISSEIKILITTREVNSFIKSIYKQMIREGYCGNAEEFLFCNEWKKPGTSKDYFYQKRITEIYSSTFKNNNLLLLEFNEFENNKTGYVNRIEAFLQINKTTGFNFDDSVIINQSYSNKRIRALKVLNKFRKSEINPHPLFKINKNLILALSKLLSFLFSNEPLVKQELIEKYLAKK
jgi:hypothetical protein